jgi:two-component system response regulator HydG
MVKILVVDDEPGWRALLQWIARGEGRRVLAAESGEQAIRLIRQHDFAVIVTDLKMETETAGLDVLKAAREKDMRTQVIVSTAYATPEIGVETMRLGAFDYLERVAPGIDLPAMMRSKVALALEFRQAKSIAIS